MNCVLNATVEHLSTVYLRQDMGLPVSINRYVMCLTCEPVDERRQRKIRALLVRHDVLWDFHLNDRSPQLEKPWHAERIETLRCMAKLYRENQGAFTVLELGS
jgi:hypothetical protein